MPCFIAAVINGRTVYRQTGNSSLLRHTYFRGGGVDDHNLAVHRETVYRAACSTPQQLHAPKKMIVHNDKSNALVILIFFIFFSL